MCRRQRWTELDLRPTPSSISDPADAYSYFDPQCLDRMEDLAGRIRDKEFSLCFIGRGLIADPELPVKLREGRFGELTEVYNRGTLFRFAEGCHGVPIEKYSKIVLPVDLNGKPVMDPDQATKAGKRIFLPTSVPDPVWRDKLGGKWLSAKL